MIRRFGVILGVVAGMLIVAPPANAAYSDCPTGRFCAWTGPNGSGVMAVYSSGDSDLSAAPGPSGMNNNIESVRNRTGQDWCLWGQTNYEGTIVTIFHGTVGTNLTGSFANWASSLRPC